MKTAGLRYGVFFSLLLLGAGCADDEHLGQGSLRLAWTTGPNVSCEQAGLHDIEATVSKGAESVQRVAFDCAQSSGFLENLLEGSYQLTLRGFDAAGLATFESAATPVRVVSGQVIDAGSVRLVALPARVELSWSFANGALCSPNGVEQIEVQIYDDEFYDVGNLRFACEEGMGSLMPLVAGDYIVELRGVGPDGVLRASQLSELSLSRGQRLRLEVSLAQAY
ncbi:MAG: hypothetical protein RBU37_09680 [Myxococcota bacterium]|nr:hypothetical protein [Myxococcota bacterium]